MIDWYQSAFNEKYRDLSEEQQIKTTE